MTKLWQLLTDELGSAFKNQYGLADGIVFKRWAHELSEFSEQQLFDGLQKFKNSGSTYMSLNVFRNHCKPSGSDIGIKPLEQLAIHICKRDWEKLHPAFQHIARDYDLYSIARMASEDAIRALRPLYNDVVARVARGEQFERLEAISRDLPKCRELSKEEREKGRQIVSELLRVLR